MNSKTIIAAVIVSAAVASAPAMAFVREAAGTVHHAGISSSHGVSAVAKKGGHQKPK